MTAITNRTDPYRIAPADSPATCVLCGEWALWRCQHCGKPACTIHASTTYCFDCELAHGRTCTRWARGSALAVGIVGAAAGATLGPILAIAALAVAAVAGYVAYEVWSARFHRYGSPIVEGARVRLSPATDDRTEAVSVGLSVGSGGRTAGALPRVPMYQRTYGR